MISESAVISVRQCTLCLSIKSVELFYPQNWTDSKGNRRTRHKLYCKTCSLKRSLDWQRADPEKHAASQSRYVRTEAGKATDRRTRAKYPLKRKARIALNNALRSGKVVKLPCAVCGNPVSEAHHLDYNDPLNVRWLCRQHHRMCHARKIEAKPEEFHLIVTSE